MKILVTSDTHGKKSPLIRLVSHYKNQVQMVIHLGDTMSDSSALQDAYPTIPVERVMGNIDFIGEPEKIITVNNCKIYMTHGHLFGVKENLQNIINRAKEKQVNVCLFGHTHFQTKFEDSGILFMNPGSLVEPRGGSNAGFGLLEITPTGSVTGEIIQL